MNPKPYPPEKRVSLARKPFEEFEQFFHELPHSGQEELVSEKRPGFRQGNLAGRVNLRHIWRDAKKPESAPSEKAWAAVGRIWHAWVLSQPPLQTLLERFDNSGDFQDGTPTPPNTNLDIECFRYLTSASIKGSISQEIIQRFYEFGYFREDKVIELYISLARSKREIQQKNDLIKELKSIEDVRREFQSLRQKMDTLLSEKYSQNELEYLIETQKESQGRIHFLQEEISRLTAFSSRITSLEQYLQDLNKDTEHSKREQQHIIEKIINKAHKYAEDIELLSVRADDNSQSLNELRSSWCSLPLTQPLSPTPLDTMSSGQHDLKRMAPTTPPIHHCDEFLQHRLLPTLAAWLLDVTPRWATLFHHAVWACRWVLVPNPAWAVAYQEAMGETAQLHIVQVEPTWLCFADAWSVVAPFWQVAQQQPDCLHLLLFEDVNRALPECWARPWLDMLAGFRKVLPVEGQPEWPVNLRILASLASDEAALPLSKTVGQHWAAVSLQSVGERSPEPAQLHEGHVPWTAWQNWGTREETATLSQIANMDDVGLDWPQFGPLVHSVVRDLCYLKASMQHLDPDIDALQTAKNIRSAWPQEYLLIRDDVDE